MKTHQEKNFLNSKLCKHKMDLNVDLNSEILNLTLLWKLLKRMFKLVSKDKIQQVISQFALPVISDLFKELDRC